MYNPDIPLPLPSVARNLRNPTLTDTKFWPIRPHTLAVTMHKNGTLCGTNVAQKWLKIRSILCNFLHSALALAQPLEKKYHLWHTFGVQNPTLSGTLLENPTLCDTEIGLAEWYPRCGLSIRILLSMGVPFPTPGILHN